MSREVTAEQRRVNPFTSDPYSEQRSNGAPGTTDADENSAANMSGSYMEIAQQINTSPVNNASHSATGFLDSAGGGEPSAGGGAVDMDAGTERIQKRNSQQQQESHHRRPDSLVTDKTFPYNLDGVVSKDGDMTHFVTENLEYKIKLSSPVTRKDIGNFYLRHNSTPSSSHSGLGGGSRSLLVDAASQHPHHQPTQQRQQYQIDMNVLNDIEIEAQYLAASLDNLTENLCNLLHSISSITADNVEIHKNAVNKLTDSMDANIKSMYTIMAKTEEISKSMKPTEQLATRIREIKRLVDMLESNV